MTTRKKTATKRPRRKPLKGKPKAKYPKTVDLDPTLCANFRVADAEKRAAEANVRAARMALQQSEMDLHNKQLALNTAAAALASSVCTEDEQLMNMNLIAGTGEVHAKS